MQQEHGTQESGTMFQLYGEHRLAQEHALEWKFEWADPSQGDAEAADVGLIWVGVDWSGEYYKYDSF